MHPTYASEFIWDEGNEEELHRHGISPVEVEQVFEGNSVWAPNKKGMSGDWKMVGVTKGGRVLTIILAWEEQELRIRAITGWDTTKGERANYLK